MKSAAAFYLRYLLIAGAIAGACYSAILARAEHLFSLDTPAAIEAAVHLVPYRSEYVARLAACNGPDRIALLKRAVQLNPFDYESLIQLGLFAEFNQGDAKAAEQYYLKAAAVNHMNKPRLTLTNYYFRQQDTSEFFRWANETLKITPYDGSYIFTNMWLMSQDAQRLSAVVPDRPRSLIQYTWFLSNTKQYGAIPPIVQRLVRLVGNDNPRAWGRDDLIASSLDKVLASGDLHTGLQFWTTLRDGRWIDQSVPDFNHPLTNGNFRMRFYGHGFDWLPLDTEGVHIDQFPDEPSIDISLTGNQPESCTLLREYVAVEGGFLYKLHWKAEAQNIPPGMGLAWHLRTATGGTANDVVSPDLLGSDQSWEFVATPNVGGFMLTLESNRPSGQVRPEGHITIRSVGMVREP
jgi:tetratricopeptide (TPR) repeat protein